VSFLLLAGLTLLIAGFIARREIPGLIRQNHFSPAPGHSDNGSAPGLADGSEKFHPLANTGVYADGARGAAGAQNAVLAAPAGSQDEQAGERITGSERRALDDMIDQKSR
jgi:hypothetical protein